MLAKLRSSLTYSNVMATVAVFAALGGTSYALVTGSIDSREIKNNTVRGKDIRNNVVGSLDLKDNAARGDDVLNNSLTGDDVLESSLGSVPDADDANTLRGLSPAQLQQPIAFGNWEGNALSEGSKNVNSVRDTGGDGTYCIDVSITPVVVFATADPGDFRYANAEVSGGCNDGEEISVHVRFADGNGGIDSDFSFVAFGD